MRLGSSSCGHSSRRCLRLCRGPALSTAPERTDPEDATFPCGGTRLSSPGWGHQAADVPWKPQDVHAAPPAPACPEWGPRNSCSGGAAGRLPHLAASPRADARPQASALPDSADHASRPLWMPQRAWKARTRPAPQRRQDGLARSRCPASSPRCSGGPAPTSPDSSCPCSAEGASLTPQKAWGRERGVEAPGGAGEPP